ncbi:MAG: hypothetical protein ACE5ER_06490, partial [Nitrospinaceae bacterium]
MNIQKFPAEQGLYDPALEKENCGVGFVARMDAVKSHTTIREALDLLNRLEHRGACGSDPR